MSRRIFRTTDTAYAEHNEQQVVATSPMPPEMYDAFEVGPMFFATLEDGTTIEAFASEILETA